MNLGLGTLAELKTHLLAEALRTATDYDAPIANLGKGVAAAFETYCGRKFGRVVGDVFTCSADRSHVVLPRYPVEAITKLELRESYADGWEDQGTVTDIIENVSEDAGLITLSSQLSTLNSSRLRVTFTGGYWFDESADGAATIAHTFKQGTITLTEGDESKAIVFDTAFGADDADVVVTPILTAPEGGMSIQVTPSAVTAEGFTALLGFAIPASGYTLRWTASIETQGTVPSGSQPDGSTARPADLFYAWLLQCEYLWKLRDKLGTDIAGGSGGGAVLLGLTLAGAQLIPEVKEILGSYRRLALL